MCKNNLNLKVPMKEIRDEDRLDEATLPPPSSPIPIINPDSMGMDADVNDSKSRYGLGRAPTCQDYREG